MKGAGLDALARLAADDPAAAEKRLARALRDEGDPGRRTWLRGLRAESLSKLGRMQEAIAETERALALDPRRAALHELRGHCLFHRKEYAAAAAAFSRGLRLDPDGVPLLARRANALWLAGRRREAEADLERCVRLEPGALTHKLALARLRILAGRGAEAIPELKRLARSRAPEENAGAAYLLGVYDFRRGRFLDAARSFAKAEAAARGGRFPGRFIDAGYSAMARGFEFMRRHPRREIGKTVSRRRKDSAGKTRLILTGLGLDYPRQATLEALGELADCDIVVNNLAGAEAMEFLSFFCRDVRTVSFEGEQPRRWADRIFRWLTPGAKVAFVTRGHPLVSGHLALQLLRRAHRAGVEVKCLSAISSVDQMFSLTQEVFGETSWGLQVLDSQLLVARKARPQTGLPLLLYLASDPKAGRHRAGVARVCAALRESYKPRQKVLVFGPRYDQRRLEELTMATLETFLAAVERRMYSSMILLLPPQERLAPARAK